MSSNGIDLSVGKTTPSKDGIDQGAIFKIKQFLCCCFTDTAVQLPAPAQVSDKEAPLAKNLVKPAEGSGETKKRRKVPGFKERNKTWSMIYGNEPKGTCRLCLKNAVERDETHTWEVAHVVSFADGGDDDLSNYRPVCRSCNRSMGRKHFKQYCQEKYPHRLEPLIREFNL